MSNYGGDASRWGNWLRNLLLPGTAVNYRQLAGDRWRNSIIASAVHWINRNMIQAPLKVYIRDANGNAVPIPNHPLELLLKRPNKYYDGDTLRKATNLSLVTGAGNAYWWIKRDKGSGLPLEFWYIPHWQIWPFWDEGATTDNWMSGYVYRLNGVDTVLPMEDVIHFRDGIDPYNPRMGLDYLDAGSREICSDNEATNYLYTMLHNLGITPVVISPKHPDEEFQPGTADLLRAQYEKQTTGDNRFRPLVANGSVDIQQIMMSPREMMLETAQDNPEARLCALIGVPIQVLGLKVGLDHSTYSNQETADRVGWEQGIIPRNMLVCAHITHQLLPDFEANPNAYLDADYSKVKALQDNQTDLLLAIVQAVGRPVLTADEGRSRLGYDSIEGGDTLYIPPAPTLPGQNNDKPGGNGSGASSTGATGKNGKQQHVLAAGVNN